MAIKIKAGQLPTSGRITMPKGTYLSNPSTAADGSLGAPKGNDIGTSIGGTDWQQSFWNPKSGQDFWQGLKGFWNNLPGSKQQPQTFYNDLGQPIQPGGNTASETWNGQTTVKTFQTATDGQGNQYTWNPQTNTFVRNSTNALSQSSPNSPSNPLVGNTLGQNEVSYTVLANMMRGSSLQEITKLMQDRGYTSTYKYGVGVVFVPNGTPNPSSQSPSGIYGQANGSDKPDWVDPTSLAPGEGVQLKNGVYMKGGTPTASGKSQYAVTYNNPNAKNDKHGKYHMVDYVTKDSAGNFVHVYRQELRKVYNRNSQRARAANNNKNAKPVASNDASVNQLVNLRANYG